MDDIDFQLSKLAWDSTDLNNILTIATTCYPDGGRAVWQARAIYRYLFKVWYEEEGCTSPAYAPPPSLIKDGTNLVSVYLRPNPAKSETQLKFNEDWPEGHVNVTIVHVSGQEIGQYRIYAKPGDDWNIPVLQWVPGTYIVRVQGAGKNAILKLIIDR